MTPQHKNFGDHAIAFSELEFFKAHNLSVIEFTDYELNVMLKHSYLLKKIVKDSPVFFTGGGFLGTIWMNYENMTRELVKMFSKNRKLFLPQTIYYDNSQYGREELTKSKKTYDTVSNIDFIAREKISYEFIKNNYKIDTYIIPDMVFFLKPAKLECQRKGATILIRDDIEKKFQDYTDEIIIDYLKSKFETVNVSDMISKSIILPKNRENALNEKFKQFFSSELVVTDRLHGMIFSVITGTPCIVLNSKSPKVKGVYDWLLKDCPYILFMDVFDKQKAEKFIASIRGKTFEYDNSFIKPYYEELLNIINGENNIERNKKCKIK